MLSIMMLPPPNAEREKDRGMERQKNCLLLITIQHYKLAVYKLIPTMVASVQH